MTDGKLGPWGRITPVAWASLRGTSGHRDAQVLLHVAQRCHTDYGPQMTQRSLAAAVSACRTTVWRAVRRLRQSGAIATVQDGDYWMGLTYSILGT